MKRKLLCLAMAFILLLGLCSCSTQTVKFDYFTGRFSPFFVISPADFSVSAMVHETILVKDPDNGNAKVLDAYSKGVGIADIALDDTDPQKLVCTIKIGDSVKFSDGTPMTADDVIFSMYVYADTDYEGFSAFGLSAIDGLTNYRYNNSLAEIVTLTDQQLDKAIAEPDEKLTALINEKVITPILKDELDWIKRSYNDDAYKGTEMQMYMDDYAEAKDLFAFLYADKDYDSTKVESEQQVFEDVRKQYEGNYQKLEDVIGEIDLTPALRRCAKEVIITNMLAIMEGEPVNSIRGIKKIDDKTVQVTINSQTDDNMQSVLGIYVAPLHIYGDQTAYDYENEKFGFTRGDLSSIREKDSIAVGAGRYAVKSHKDLKSITFKKNENYFGDKSNLTSSVTFEATGNSNESKIHSYYVTYDNYMAIKNQKSLDKNK